MSGRLITQTTRPRARSPKRPAYDVAAVEVRGSIMAVYSHDLRHIEYYMAEGAGGYCLVPLDSERPLLYFDTGPQLLEYLLQ